MRVAVTNGPPDNAGGHGREQRPERQKELGAGRALMPDKVAYPDRAAVNQDFAVPLQHGEASGHALLRQSRFKGDLAPGHGEDAEVVGVGGREQVDV